VTEPQQYGTLPPQGSVPAGSVPRNRGRRRFIALIVLVAVVAGIAIAAWASHRSSPDAAGVDDCVTKPQNDSIKVVGCESGKAAMRVVGKVENKTQVQVSLNSAEICKPFPKATNVYWRGELGKPGYVLCLAPLK
jgi:hypothetical protein